MRPGQFTVNPAGTSLTFATPAVANPGVVDLVLTAGTAVTTDVYTYTTATGTVPGAPTAVNATGLDRSISVRFTPPASTGGSVITAYQVSVDGGRTWRAVSTRASTGGNVILRDYAATPVTTASQAMTGTTAASWCVNVRDNTTGATTYKYSAQNGLETGKCASRTTP